MSKPPDWKTIADEVEAAFADGSVLNKDRKTLESWMVSLSIGTHKFSIDQEPMIRRLNVLKHLVSVRLTEEAEERREEQSNLSEDRMLAHNRVTRWIAIAAIVIPVGIKIFEVIIDISCLSKR